MRAGLGAWRRLRRDRAGVSAIEFACALPIFLLLLLGGSEYARALAISRKVTLTTRAVADLATRVTTLSETDVTTVLNASAQIMAPYSTSGIAIVLSQVTTSSDGTTTTVAWSRTLNGTALKAGATFTLASGAAQAGASLIVSQVTYAYTPIFGSSFVKALSLSDMLYMSPRLSAQVKIGS